MLWWSRWRRNYEHALLEFKNRRRLQLLSRFRHRNWLRHPAMRTRLDRRVEGLKKEFRRVRQRHCHRLRRRCQTKSHRRRKMIRCCRKTANPTSRQIHRALRCSTNRTFEWSLKSSAWWCPRWAPGSWALAAVPRCPTACSSPRCPCPIDQWTWSWHQWIDQFSTTEFHHESQRSANMLMLSVSSDELWPSTCIAKQKHFWLADVKGYWNENLRRKQIQARHSSTGTTIRGACASLGRPPDCSTPIDKKAINQMQR